MVEAGGELVELVVRLGRNARAELARLHPVLGLDQAAHGEGDVQMTHVERQDRPSDRQRHHHELKQGQEGAKAHQYAFDRQHQQVHLIDEGIDLGDQLPMAERWAVCAR